MEIISGDLMAEAPAAAMEHDDDLIRNADAKSGGELFVEDVLRASDLDFEIMVS